MDRVLAERREELKIIGIAEEHLNCLATTIRDELMSLDAQTLKATFPLYYPDAASISDQIIYSWTFAESHMSLIYTDDSVNHIAVLAANYFYFVYTQDTLLTAIISASPKKGPSRILAQFLTSGQVRAFRNAFSHGTWRYSESSEFFKTIEYRSIDKGNLPIHLLEPSTLQLWQQLSKTLIGLWVARIADLRQPLKAENSL